MLYLWYYIYMIVVYVCHTFLGLLSYVAMSGEFISKAKSSLIRRS